MELSEYARQRQRPFAVIVSDPLRRAATIEPDLAHARRRAIRALDRFGARNQGEELFPESRTRFIVEKRSSYAVSIKEFEVTIAISWLYLNDGDDSWHDPTIVAALGRENEPLEPRLFPSRTQAQTHARHLVSQFKVPAERVLLLPANDRRGTPHDDPAMPTLGGVLGDYTVIEEVAQAVIAEHTSHREVA